VRVCVCACMRARVCFGFGWRLFTLCPVLESVFVEAVSDEIGVLK